MIRILLPTDFSGTSEKAAHFAVDLYGTEGVRYTLVNSFQLQAGPEVLMPDLTTLAEQGSRLGVRNAERRLRKHAPGVSLAKVSTYVPLPEALNDLAQRKGGDLIVMGTQGKSSTPLIGRYASSMVQRAELPLITVPWHWEPRPVQRILLPMDGGPLDAGTLRPLVDLVHRCGANVVVAHVRTNAVDFTQGLDRTAIDAALKGIEHSYITVAGDNVVDSMNELANGGRIQLVAMVHRKRGFLHGLFHLSNTKQMALHTKLPLLVLRHDGTGPRS